MSDTLNVHKREQTGSLRMKRLRQAGKIPAVLYGHGQENLMLTVEAKELNRAIDHGSFVVQLKGAANEDALIKDVQWDAFGIDVLHVDLTRVNPNEKVEITVPVQLRGDAVGAHHGGTINFMQHELTIACPAKSVPDHIELHINELDVNQTITAGEVPLPEGFELAVDKNLPVVSCEIVSTEPTEDETGGETPEAAADEPGDASETQE